MLSRISRRNFFFLPLFVLDFICWTLDLVSGGPARNAGMEISLVTPDGRKPFYKRVKCHRFERTDGTEERSGIHSKGEAWVR